MVNKDYIQKLLDHISDSDIDKSKFGPFYNLMLLPIAHISEPIEYRLRRLEDFQGITNFSTLTDRELEIAASTHLIFRKEGSVGTGYARVIVKNKTSLTIPAGTKLFIEIDGKKLEFEAAGVSFTEDNFSVSIQFPNYFISPYFTISTTTKDADYNILTANSVLRSTLADTNIVYFILDSITSPVVSRETNSQLYNRLINQTGAKQLNNELGVVSLFNEYFPNVPIVAVYGNNDVFVTRNTIKIFAPRVDEEWFVLNYKGKIAGSPSVPHYAFGYLLTNSGVEYNIVDENIELIGLNDPTNFLLYEASQTDYNALQMKLSEEYFETGHGVFLSKETFTTDPEWVASDCYFGYNQLFNSTEITISGTTYILGAREADVKLSQFIIDLLQVRR